MENETPSPLSETTQREIATLVRQISVAHHLDADIQAELAAHIEDKLTAYLNGSEKPTETDALLLAKSHFGNPATLKSLFHHSHPTAHHTTLARKLAALTIATAAAIIASNLVMLAADYIVYTALRTTSHAHALFAIQQSISEVTRSLLIPCILALILLRLRRQQLRNQSAWFQAARPLHLLLAVTAALCSLLFFRQTNHYLFTLFIHDTIASLSVLRLSYWLQYLNTFVLFFLWLCWSDTKPRLWRSLLLTAVAYFLFRTVFVDLFWITSVDAMTGREILVPFRDTAQILASIYLRQELPGILLAALTFLLVPRRKPSLSTT